MNNYGQWWNSTITLYNKFKNPDDNKIYWYRHVIKDCFYNHSQNEIVVGQSKIASDVSVCRIRVNDSFKDKRSWNELNSSEKEQFFTLAPGDIIVADETEFEINEYEKGKRSSDMMAEYKEWPGCFTVKSVNINVGGGRGNEHYLARGV